MKRIVLTIALALTVISAGAQSSKMASAAKKVQKCVETSQNPKKAEAPATWVALGDAYISAYEAPTGDFMLGASLQEMELIASQSGLKIEQPISTSTVVLEGQNFTKNEYQNFDCYINEAGRISLLVVTHPAAEDPLLNALLSYTKASELPGYEKLSKKLNAGLTKLNEKFTTCATTSFAFGDLAGACTNFELAAQAAATAPLCKVDSVALYNAGLSAYIMEDYAKASKFFNECAKVGYYGAEGETFVKIADIAAKNGDDALAQSTLEEAFVKFPQSQQVLIELINFYSLRGENTSRLFELLDNARSADASGKFNYYFSYVEGNVRNQLGDIEGAVEAYGRSAQENPDYEYAYIGIAQVYSGRADALVVEINAASEKRDWDKADALTEKYFEYLALCVEPFEKAFSISKDGNIKLSVANILKQVCYRLSGQNVAGSTEKYNFYKEYIEANQ